MDYDIYISSTYEDLKAERAAVRDAAVDCGLRVAAMESYSADSRPPLQRCLADVMASRLFLVIVGDRRGSLPPERRESFTELEYEQARLVRRDCLVFVKRPGGATEIPPDEKEAVESFRKRVQRERTAKEFGTVAELKYLAGMAIKDWWRANGASNENALEVPALLPSLCDRSAQVERLKDALHEHRHAESPKIPVIAVMHGSSMARMDLFIERLMARDLVHFLGGDTPILRLKFPERDSSAIDRFLQSAFARELELSPEAGRDELVGTVKARRISMIVAPIVADAEKQHDERRIVAFLEWFKKLTLDRTSNLLVLITVQYVDPVGGFFRRRAVGRENERIAAIIERLGREYLVLPKLGPITTQHVLDWALEPEVREFGRKHFVDEDLVQSVRPLAHELSESTMETAAGRLREFLKKELRRRSLQAARSS